MGPVHAVGSMEIGIYRNLQNKPIYLYNNWGENGGKGRAYEKKILKISMKLRILQLPRKLQVSKFIIPFPSPIPKYFINSNQSLCCLYQYAADAAKSLQSCPTLCDPIDGSPPGSAVPGILQARTLEWVAISFSISIWAQLLRRVERGCLIPRSDRARLLCRLCLVGAHLRPVTHQQCGSGTSALCLASVSSSLNSAIQLRLF